MEMDPFYFQIEFREPQYVFWIFVRDPLFVNLFCYRKYKNLLIK